MNQVFFKSKVSEMSSSYFKLRFAYLKKFFPRKITLKNGLNQEPLTITLIVKSHSSFPAKLRFIMEEGGQHPSDGMAKTGEIGRAHV